MPFFYTSRSIPNVKKYFVPNKLKSLKIKHNHKYTNQKVFLMFQIAFFFNFCDLPWEVGDHICLNNFQLCMHEKALLRLYFTSGVNKPVLDETS